MRALCDKDLPLVWLPEIPSWTSSNSGSTAFEWTQSKYGPKNNFLYNLYSLESQYCGAFLRIFSASNLSMDSAPSFKNEITWSIQLALTCMLFTLIGAQLTQLDATRSLTIMTRGRPCPKELVKVTNELAWQFLLLELALCRKLQNWIVVARFCQGTTTFFYP